MPKKDSLEERIGALEQITSEDLADLNPHTIREYMMVMWPAQQKMLEHLEKLNGFKTDAIKDIASLKTRQHALYAIVIVTVLGTVFGIAATLMTG